jgi:hypothetical protein
MMTTLLVGMSLVMGQANPGDSAKPLPADGPAAVAPSTVPPPPPATSPPAPEDNGKKNGNGNGNKEPNSGENGFADFIKPKSETGAFHYRLYKAYYEQFFPPPANGEEEPEPARRGLPSPWDAPPFPGSEYQGYPLLGVPRPDPGAYPIMKAIYGANTSWSEAIKNSKIQFTGWVTAAGTWSTANNTNVPTSYWIVPNRFELDQLVFKLERVPDTAQTDHIDWGFRSIALYGMDYRYTTAGGWGSDQLLKHNNLYGWDPTEQYFNVYIPGFLQGTDIRVGRWIACPDIETQYSVDNYMGSHSILFTYDTYTQTGIMLSQKLNDQWMVQFAIHAGTDMAPWYKGSLFTPAAGVRWVSKDNNDAVYAWLNAINSAEFRHFQQYGQPLGHDNFNYFVATWEHRFNKDIHTKTEAYYMWQRNAEVGGTPSVGPLQPYGGGGGDGTLIPGYTQTWGVLNYTMFAFTKRDYVVFRNEVWRDDRGMRAGFPGTYTSNSIGLSHQFNDVLMVRPEIGYYRNWNNPAFDLGTKHDVWLYGFDVTLRF